MGKLNGLLNRFVEVLPIEKTYLIIVDAPKDIKITKNLVRLNYSHLSPMKDADFVFLKRINKLFIWFTNDKLAKKIYIPEAFLLLQRFKSKKEAVVLKNTEGKSCVLVIKNGKILSQFCTKDISTLHLDLIKRKFNLSNPEIINLNGNLQEKIGFRSVLKFLPNLNVNSKDVARNLYECIKVPIIVVLVLFDVFGLLTYNYLNYQIKRSKAELSSLKLESKDAKHKFEKLQSYGDFFRSFEDEELAYPSFYEALSKVLSVLKKNGAKLVSYNQYQGSIALHIISPSISSVVNDLLSYKSFKDVQVLNTSQYYYDKSKEQGNLKILLKRKGL